MRISTDTRAIGIAKNAAVVIAAAGLAVALTACGSAPERRAVSAADFGATAPVREPAQRTSEATMPVVTPTEGELASTRELIATVELEPGSPDVGGEGDSTRIAATEVPVLVDAKVGDINGRPIQASSFFEPLEARLKAEAERMRRAEWRRFARQQIELQLDLTVEDELLRSEALELLPEPVRKAGLRRFIDSIREQRISQAGGSSTAANRRVEGETGQSLDEQAERALNDELVSLAYQTEIQGRVHVSRHDIELEYERNYGQFNPTPAAIYRTIRISKRDAEAIERVEAGLEAGEEFASVAEDRSNLEKEIFRKEFPGPDAAYGEIVLFSGEDDANAAIQALEPGDWAGPIDTGRSTVWWYQLVEIDRPDRMSLYEAQALIEQALRRRLEGLERERYITDLKRRASYTDLGAMTERLLAIAETRYFGPAQAQRGRG